MAARKKPEKTSDLSPVAEVDFDQITSEVEDYKRELISMMVSAGINPANYDYAIRLCAETLRERDRVYKDYLKKEELRTSMCAWNSQARASLSMLKLTPWRVLDNNDTSESD